MSKKKSEKVMKLDPLTLLKLENALLHKRAVESELRVQQIMRAAYLKQIDPDSKLDQFDESIHKLREEFSMAEESHSQAVRDAEISLKIDMREYSYDDETGILYKL